MASTGHDPLGVDQTEIRHSGFHLQQQQQQHVSDQDVNHDDNVRSWLEATSPSLQQQPWPLEDTDHEEPFHVAVTAQGEPLEPVEGGEFPPPYRETDPAKDYPSTYEFELDDNHNSDVKLYTPFFLRTWIFVTFAFTFAAMLIAVEVLHQFSNRNHGLSTQEPNKHYLWTYGPTIFLTITACFWGQVEYRVKQLMPWKAMTKGPAPADDVLLMDYVSPWNVSALITAIKAKHAAVVLAITGTLLIKLAIIFSAGLLSLGPERVFQGDAAMRLKDNFITFSSSDNTSRIQPVITAIGASQYGLSLPPGTTELFAVQSFEAVENITDQSTILVAEVNAFSADLECEPASVSKVSAAQCSGSSSDEDCNTVDYNVTVHSQSCTTNATQISVSVNDASDQYYGSVSSSSCQERANDYRFTFLSGHEFISYSEGAGNASRSTALICQPTYSLCLSAVSLYLNGSINRIMQANVSCSSIPNVSAWDIADMITNMIEQASSSSPGLFQEPSGGYNGSYVNIDPFFKLMNATALPANITQFNNATYLESSARHLYSLLAAQLAKTSLMTSTQQHIEGLVIANQQRLFVRRVALRLLESIFALLIAISLVTLLLRPTSSVPCDTSSIAGMARVLARSSRTTLALQGLGTSRWTDLKHRLTGRTCHTTVTNEPSPVFRLITSPGDGNRDVEDPSSTTFNEWWRPFSMSIYVRIGLAILPLGLIAALEAVYQHSTQQNGLADVGGSNPYLYAWTLLPALLMMLVQVGYRMIDASTRILQPYQTLRSFPATADRSIFVNYLSQITPHAIWEACSRRHYAVALTGLTMVAAPLLTVVSSGLYVPMAVEKFIPTSITMNDTIDNTLAWNEYESSNSDLVQLISTLIVEANMSFVSWTYDGFVLPKLDTDAFLDAEFGSNSTANTTSVRVTMPAYSAALNCEYAYPNITLDLHASGASYADVTVPVPAGCGNKGDSNYLHLGNITLPEGQSDYGIVYVSDNTSLPQSCPQVAFLYGQGTVYGENNTVQLNLSAARCSPTVYRVMTNTTFALPGFTIQSVEAYASTVETIAMGGWNNATLDLESWFPVTDWGVAPLFGGLSPGREGVAWTDLIGEQNFARFSDAVDDLYGIMYSQWLNIYGRTSPPATSPSLSAVVNVPTRLRLMQSAVSTRILEGLLAVMAICVVAAFFLLDTRKLLSQNPCNIGAMTALLADSEMLRSIPEGAEWLKDQEVKSKRVFSDHLFSLDWFEGLSGTRRFGIDFGNGETGNSGG